MISPKHLETKNSNPNQINHNHLYSSQSIQSLNFLDQFKLKKPSINQYLKLKNSLVNSNTPAQKLNKQIHNPTHNLYTSTSPKHFTRGNYFVNSLNYNKDDKNPHKIRSKDKSISHRSKKSPLRKLVKSQSHQMLYDPIQRVFKVIQQEQKARESQKLNQKTLKHLNFIPTFSELNDSFLNLAQNIKEIKSSKNFNQLKSFQKKKSTHDLILSRQYPNFENKKNNKNQELNRNRLNKAKSVQVMNYVVSRRNLNVKISGSKVKNYFSLKQENQKKNKTIRNLLQNMGKRQIQETNLRKVNSYNEISQISLSQPSKLSNQNDISHRKHVKNKIEVQPYEYSQSGQSFNQDKSYSKEKSDYGFQIKSNTSKKSLKQKKFIKTEKRVKEQVPLDLKNMKMYVVDPKDIKKSSDFQVHFSHSESMENYENSTPSIEEYIHRKQNNVQKSSYVSSKKSVNSESQKFHSSQASKSEYHPVQSVNTPAYRDGMQKKVQKSSIINEQKDDKVNQRKKFLSVSSKKSMSELIQIDSKINKKSYDSAKKLTLQGQMEQRNFLKTPKIQSSSIINDLSNLIDNSSKHSSSIENVLEKPQVKKGQVKFQKRQNQVSYGNLKTSPKLSTVKDHEFSEFQIIKQSQRELTLKAYNQKRVDNSLQMSIDSDLGLKSKRSIVQQESSVQRSHEIPIHSSVSMRSFKKSIGQQSLFQKKEESKKVIKFLKVTSKKNQPSIQPVKIEERIEQQRSQVESKSQKSLRNKELFESVKSQKSRQRQKESNIKQNKFQTESKQESLSNKSGQLNKSVEGSSFSQSSQKSSESDSSKSKSIKKSQKITRKDQQYSESSYSESSHSRTLTKSVTNNLSKASSPHSISKSSLPNQNFKLQLHSKESQSLVDSSYNNSSQTSLSNSTSNNILRHSTKKAENFSKKDESLMFKKKKNFAQYTLNDVARLIQEHEFRIQAYCLYVDNSKSIYEQDYQLQKIQLLSFLMLKKSVYELNRAIDALNGKGLNVFCLTDIEIQDDPFEDYRERQQIIQQRDNMVKSKKQTFQELKQTFLSFEKKYSGQKGFNLSLQKDDTSSQIVKKLSQQLNLLYEKWEQNKSNDHQLPKITKKLQKRMMEIIELIFLTSELDGQKVKGCQLFTDTQTEIDFRSYYEKWFQKIIETIEYFDGRKSTNQQN